QSTATCHIYPLSLHDALPIYRMDGGIDQLCTVQHSLGMDTGRQRLIDSLQLLVHSGGDGTAVFADQHKRRTHDNLVAVLRSGTGDRKSTRLNSSHVKTSYAVF